MEREKAHAERRCGCSAPILTERAPSSRTWDCPAAANPSPGPDPPNRRGSPVTKVAAGAGQRARGVGTGSRAQKFLPRSLGVLGVFACTWRVFWGFFFPCEQFWEEVWVFFFFFSPK